MAYTDYCSVNWGGQLLDAIVPGYLTTNVEGRGLLSRVLTTTEPPGAPGSVVTARKIPSRTLQIHFLLEAPSSALFQERLTLLHSLLETDGSEVRVELGDEPDHYRMGWLSSVQDPPFDSLRGQGTFSLYMADPFRYEKALQSLSGASFSLPGTATDPRYPYRLESLQVTLGAARTGGYQIDNGTTGRSFVLLGDFASGDMIRIVQNPDGITVNGVAAMDRLDFINSDWNEFELHGGDTIVALDPMVLEFRGRLL